MPSRFAWILCASLTAWGAPLGAQQLVPVERARLAAAVWAEVRYNAPALDESRADWDSALTSMLRDGRAAVVPPGAVGARWARPPLVLRGVERRPFLVDYAENDEMRVARPERNAEILAVQGIPAERWIRDSVLPEIAAATDAARWELAVSRMLEGEKGTAI